MEAVVKVSRPLGIEVKWIGLCRFMLRRERAMHVSRHTGYGVGRELDV